MPPPPDAPSEPWRSFLSALDAELPQPVHLHCIGGFVLGQAYGLVRETSDLDLLGILPTHTVSSLVQLAGRGSPLAARFRVCLDPVTVVNAPDSYESRLQPLFPLWPHLHLWALEPHDLALTKLERSNERDIRDIIALAHAGLLDPQTLLHRFQTEMEPYLVGRTPNWHRDTLNMWLQAAWPV